MTKGKAIAYSADQREWLRSNAQPLQKPAPSRRDLHARFVEKFGRSDVSLEHIKSLCHRNGWKTGRDGRLQKGNVPANKGKQMPYNANSARTRFKKGQICPNAKPVGFERICSKDGYVYICTDQRNPYTGRPRFFVVKHKYLWEKANGPIPKGHHLKCLDGNKTNCDPSNWVCLPNSAKVFLNGGHAAHGIHYDHVAAELKPAVITLAKLKAATGGATKRGRR